MILHAIQDLSNQPVTALLMQGLSNIAEHDLVHNYHPLYIDRSENIFNMLSTGKFSQGNYYVIENQGEYVGSAGWYQYTEEVSLVLVRAYIVPKFRTQYLMASQILPNIFEECKSKKLWITCNSYNKVIYTGLVNMSNGKSAGIYNWPAVYGKFKPVGTKIVNSVAQYIAEYERQP